jgi:uncharacterized protein
VLSADEQDRVRQSIAGVARAASALLNRADSAYQAQAVVMLLHQGLDKLLAAANGTPPAIECRPGCAHCCNARVEVSEHEAALIAAHLGRWTDDERDPAIARLVAKAGRPDAGQPCALLQDGHCSVYPIRPAVCRKAHSLSAAACRSGTAPIPQQLALVVQCEALIAGTNQAFEQHGLPAARLELSAAVLAALGRGDECDGGYRGEPRAP